MTQEIFCTKDLQLPIRMKAGDTLHITHKNAEGDRTFFKREITENQTIDRVVLGKVTNEYGVKTGLILVMGEKDESR